MRAELVDRIEAAGGWGKHTAADVARVREEVIDAWRARQRRQHTRAVLSELQSKARELERGWWTAADFGAQASAALAAVDSLIRSLTVLRDDLARAATDKEVAG
jgi:hypothetical protein